MASRDVKLNIKASDGASAPLKSVATAAERAAKALATFEGATSTRDAAAAYAELAGEVERATRAFAAQEAKIAAEQAELGSLAVQLVAARQAIRNLTAASQAEGADKVALTAKLKAAEAGYRDLDRQYQRTIQSIARGEAALGKSRNQLQGIASAANAAEVALAGRAAGKNTGPLLGLKPHEAQNLLYQVNDLVTQIGSGTPVLQAFAQQGGQIIQIFPKLLTGLLKGGPIIAGLVVVFGTLAAAIKGVADQAATSRSFDKSLAASADGASRSADDLAKVTHKLDLFGASLKEARETVAIGLTAGIDTSQLERFGQVAANVATVTGESIPEAAKRMASAFTRGFDAVRELDKATNFLTAAELEQIRVLFQSGDAAGARAKAFDAFAARMDAGAQKARGPWSTAFRDLGRAWGGFIDSLGRSAPIQGTIDLLTRLGNAAAAAAAKLPGVNLEVDIARTQEQLRELRDVEARVGRRPVSDALIAERTRHLSNLQARQGPIAGPTGADPLAAQREAARKVTADIAAGLDAEAKGLRAVTTAQKVALSGQRAYAEAVAAGADAAGAAQIRAQAESLESFRLSQLASREAAATAKREAEAAAQRAASIRDANADRRFELNQLAQPERQQAINSALRSAEEPSRANPDKPGASLAKAQRQEIERTTAALFDQQQALKAAETLEAARLALSQKQGQEIDRQAAIQLQAKAAGIDLATEQGRQYGEIIGKIIDIEAAEKRAAEAGRRVNDLLADRAELQEQAKFARDQGDLGRANALDAAVLAINAKLRDAISASTALWQALGGPEAEAAILRLQGLNQQLDVFGQRITLSVQQSADMLTNAGVTAFDQFAQAVAQGENVLGSFGQAFAGMAAEIMHEISMIILRQQLMNLLMKTGIAGKLASTVNSVVDTAPIVAGATALTAAGGAVAGGGSVVLAAAIQLQAAAAALAAANAIGGAASFGGLFHRGGVVGAAGGQTREVSPAWFNNATRYHQGGIAGLKPGEMPAILKRGEEVLTDKDPRHVANGGGTRGPSASPVRNVLVLKDEDIAGAMAGASGEEVILTHLSRNKPAIRQMLGVKSA